MANKSYNQRNISYDQNVNIIKAINSHLEIKRVNLTSKGKFFLIIEIDVRLISNHETVSVWQNAMQTYILPTDFMSSEN